MPAPAFGALMVAIFGIEHEPKIAIVFIGSVFTQVLVIANTVRKVDPALLEAAQTLGAKRRQLLLGVIVPFSLPDLYNDMRILLGCAWTYLIVAEAVGICSGITFFINQQAKYRNFDNVYAANYQHRHVVRCEEAHEKLLRPALSKTGAGEETLPMKARTCSVTSRWCHDDNGA